MIFRLGRVLPQPKGPGLSSSSSGRSTAWSRSSLRTVVLDVPPQDVITRDNVSVKVNAVVYFRVIDPERARSSRSRTTSTPPASSRRPRCARCSARPSSTTLLSEREKLNQQLQEIIDQHTDPWGIKVSMVEVKHVDLPQEMQRAMARQAEAEREKRAKIIHAEGEFAGVAGARRGGRR